MRDNVVRNDTLRLESNDMKYRITHGGTRYIGMLAKPKANAPGMDKSGSDIQRQIMHLFIGHPWPNLEGLFVNDVFVWTYEDTVRSDEKSNTQFAGMWCDEAKKRGFIYVVDFAGYAKEV